ncbi:LuxR C-terminal-related transcriptional regulator [Bradyrhizobium erythrophlei]|uniref:LuxR C-terminal-related transcriptional regulator n=1 Tax=Bradyrhizobium erythrophlei TaxID=1437360 RepID=UPI0035E9B743
MTEMASRPPDGPGPSPEALQSIVSTKLFPPREAGRLLPRDNLIARLVKARRHRCVLVHSPAGSGKTSIVAAWRRELLALGFDVVWLTLAPDDNDASRWLDYLLASFGQVDPTISRAASQLAGRGIDREAIERTLIALVRSIAERPREIVLVLDDLHLLTDAASRWALQWLLDQAPRNLHVVLVCRGAAPVSLSRLRDQQGVFELDFQDLRFSQAETDAFLQSRLGEIDRRTTRRIHELTDGWVAGLQLLSIGWSRKRDPREIRLATRGQIQDEQSFADYFEHEILSKLSKSECALLEAASICNRFCASLCAALLGKEESSARIEALLASLVTQNGFIIPVETSDRDTWYRFHPLLGEAMRARFRQRAEVQQRQCHKEAWSWFRDRGYVDEAVRHAVSADEASAAADLLDQYGQDLLARGEFRNLNSLVRRLPEQEVQSRTNLRLWMARSQLLARELDACAESLARLDADLPASDVSARFALALVKATLAVARDDTDAAMLVLPQLLHPPPGIDPASIGGRDNILSWLYMHRANYELARQVQLGASSISAGGAPLLGSPGGRLQGRCLVGLSYALEGQIIEAERIYRDALYESEQRGASCIDPACLAAALLGEALYELNDPAGALQMLEDRVDVLERVSIPDSVLRVLTVLSASHWLAGRRQEAFSYLDRLEDYALNLKLDRLLAYSVGEQVRRHLEQAEFEAAARKLTTLDEIGHRHPKSGSNLGDEIFIIVERAHVRGDLAVGRYDDAAARLVPLIEICEARGHQQIVAALQLQGAVIAKRRGMGEQAGRMTLAALRLGHRLGLVRSLLDADASAPDLVCSCGEASGVDVLLSFYVERLRDADLLTQRATPSSRRDAAESNSELLESLSERELDVIRLLAQAFPNKKIARALGLSPDTVKWHLKNIYGKLGVAGRDDAVARMRDIGWSPDVSTGRPP